MMMSKIETMFEDAKILLENGADGISFGFLNSDATINVTETKKDGGVNPSVSKGSSVPSCI